MSLKGVITPPDFTKYTQTESRKFNAIIDAQNTSNHQLAQELYDSLNSEEESKFEQFVADCQQFQEYKKQAQSKIAYHQSEVKASDTRSEALQDQRKVIIHQGTSQVASALPTSITPAPSNGHSDTNGHTPKKKKGGCTIM